MTNYVPLKGTLATLIRAYGDQANAGTLAMSRILIEGIETGFLGSRLTVIDGHLYDLERTIAKLRAEIARVTPYAERLDNHALGLTP